MDGGRRREEGEKEKVVNEVEEGGPQLGDGVPVLLVGAPPHVLGHADHGGVDVRHLTRWRRGSRKRR